MSLNADSDSCTFIFLNLIMTSFTWQQYGMDMHERLIAAMKNHGSKQTYIRINAMRREPHEEQTPSL